MRLTPPSASLALILLVAAAPTTVPTVHLVVRAPASTKDDDAIYLAGSLEAVGGWRADGVRLARRPDGTFAGDVALQPGATLEFKFTRDGTWATVERAADGGDVPNRAATIDAARLDATVARWSDPAAAAAAAATTAPAPAHTVVGDLRLHTLDAPTLRGTRTIRVWLPAGYDAKANADARYPVLYLHDGQNCFDRATSAFGDEWRVDETLTRLIADGTVPPTIVVGVDNGGARRIDELTFDADARHGGGHGEAYAAFLLDAVVPFVERTYRAQADAAHRYLGGSSLGGLATLEIARRHPGTFAGAIVMSPSLWWDDQHLTDAIERDAGGLAPMRVWVDVGTREGGGDDAAQTVANVRRLDAVLARQHVADRLEVADGAAHNERAWAARFARAITFVTTGK